MATKPNAIVTTYKSEFTNQRASGKWTPKKSAIVSLATLAVLEDGKNKPVALTNDEKEVIEGIFNPTSKSKITTIAYVLAQHGIDLDDDTAGLLSKLFNATSVQKQIDDLDKPAKLRLKDLIAS